MPSDASARRVLSFTMGIASIFDLTGATIYRLVRPCLPASQETGTDADPFSSALSTIVAAHRDAVLRAPDTTA
jgi:hypothetical protein